MYVIKDELDHFEENLQKLYRFLVIKVRSGSGILILNPEPVWPKGSGFTVVLKHMTMLCIKIA